MKTLDDIRQQLSAGEFEFSRHAFKRAVERNISAMEIQEAGAQARIIEDYPEDKYAPSSLLLGFTRTNRPLHIQISHVDSVCSRSLRSMSRTRQSGMITPNGGSYVSLSRVWED